MKEEITKVQIQDIRLSDIVRDLEAGLCRYKSENKRGLGSIQEKYNLSYTDTKRLFDHPELKNRKKHKDTLINIINDLNKEDHIDMEDEDTSVQAELDTNDGDNSDDNNENNRTTTGILRSFGF